MNEQLKKQIKDDIMTAWNTGYAQGAKNVISTVRVGLARLPANEIAALLDQIDKRIESSTTVTPTADSTDALKDITT